MISLDNYKHTVISFIFALFPLSFILGNLFINLNLTILFLLTFTFYYDDVKYFKFNLFDKIISIFFVYSFLVLLINFFEAKLDNEIFSSTIVIKTIFYLRYFFLYIALRFLLERRLIRSDWFFYLCAFFSIFVCFDIFFQFTFGKDIFGISPIAVRKLSGPFGDELIAGGYIQRFCLFALFSPLLFKVKVNPILIQIFLFLIFFLGIILSGNRMPLIIFFFSIALIFILQRKLRKYFFLFIIIISVLTVSIYTTNKPIRDNFNNFFNTVELLTKYFYTKRDRAAAGLDNTGYVGVPYTVEIDGFYKTWKKNKFFGGGIRSYRINCPFCNSHPHNYYFEILDDLGLIGFSIVFFLFFLIIYKIFINKYFFYSKNNFNQISLPLFCVVFFEFFPFRTSGSFFSTNNAAFIFIILALIVTMIETHTKIEKELKT